jgi:hypothetical protein
MSGTLGLADSAAADAKRNAKQRGCESQFNQVAGTNTPRAAKTFASATEMIAIISVMPRPGLR